MISKSGDFEMCLNIYGVHYFVHVCLFLARHGDVVLVCVCFSHASALSLSLSPSLGARESLDELHGRTRLNASSFCLFFLFLLFLSKERGARKTSSNLKRNTTVRIYQLAKDSPHVFRRKLELHAALAAQFRTHAGSGGWTPKSGVCFK